MDAGQIIAAVIAAVTAVFITAITLYYKLRGRNEEDGNTATRNATMSNNQSNYGGHSNSLTNNTFGTAAVAQLHSASGTTSESHPSATNLRSSPVKGVHRPSQSNTATGHAIMTNNQSNNSGVSNSAISNNFGTAVPNVVAEGIPYGC